MFVPSYNSSRRCKYRKRYPQEVVRLIAKKRALWKKRTLRPNDLRIRWQYRECVNALRSSCRRFDRDKEESIVDANNLGIFYRYVNQQLTHRGNIGALVDSAGELITSEGQKADMFNVYFGSVCITDNGINPRCPVSETTSVLETVAFTQQEVLVAIKKLQSNLSSGPDGLPPLLYKRGNDSLAYPLAIMFTQLFSVGIVPYEWKNAIVTPIF